jgi:hypothetical protein
MECGAQQESEIQLHPILHREATGFDASSIFDV